MKVTSATFVTSVPAGGEMPVQSFPHIVFVGRSNVGKSSVINSLLNHKNLAHSSSTPGHTRTINFYLANKRFFVVDLPGYGYAKASFKASQELAETINWYLEFSEMKNPQIVVLIVDAKVGVTDLDRQMIAHLQELSKTVVVIANKIDKLKKNDVTKQLKTITEEVTPYHVIPYSAHEKIGVTELSYKVFI